MSGSKSLGSGLRIDARQHRQQPAILELWLENRFQAVVADGCLGRLIVQINANRGVSHKHDVSFAKTTQNRESHRQVNAATKQDEKHSYLLPILTGRGPD